MRCMLRAGFPARMTGWGGNKVPRGRCEMNNKTNKVLAAVGSMVAVLAFAGSAYAVDDQIDTAIGDVQANVLRYTGAALTAIVAVVLLGVGIRVVPKIIRAVAARVTG